MSDVREIIETTHEDGTQSFTVITEDGGVGTGTWDPEHDADSKRDDALTSATEEALSKE